MTKHKPAAGAYVRISDDRLGDAAGVSRQEQDCRELAARRGWDLKAVYVENDTSAFKRRKVRLPDGSTALRVDRPAFRQMLKDMASGVITALAAYDLDRVARDPRDLEDLIDVVETKRIPTAAVTGSLDLSNDAGITMARIMVAVANKSSRDTARRVARKQLSMAEEGKFSGGGIRPYGYERDGLTIVPAEAAVLREIADRLIGGESLTGIARDLNRRGVPTVQGSDRGWQVRSVHSAITKARIAGLRAHKGEIIGQAEWPAILDQEKWLDVKAALAARATGKGNILRHWLSGVMVCGPCQHRMTSQFASSTKHKYWCDHNRGGCARNSIDGARTEAFVEEKILHYLQRPDVVTRIAAAVASTDKEELRAQLAADEAQLVELANLWAARDVSTVEYLAARNAIKERVDHANEMLRAAAPDALRHLLSAKSIPVSWAAMEPRERQAVAHALFPNGIVVTRAIRRSMYDPARLQLPEDVRSA